MVGSFSAPQGTATLTSTMAVQAYTPAIINKCSPFLALLCFVDLVHCDEVKQKSQSSFN